MPVDGKVVALPLDQFRLRLGDLVGIAVPTKPSALREYYMKKRDELVSRRAKLKRDELIALGGFHYRLNEFDRAFAAWREANRSAVAINNLALLELARGNSFEARSYLALAGPVPRAMPEMTPEQSVWELRVEKILRQLIKDRAREQQAGMMIQQLPLDSLLGVKFASDWRRIAALAIQNRLDDLFSVQFV